MTRLLISVAAVALLSTAAQAQPRLRGAMPNFDSDRDGKVTAAEFKTGQAERQDRMFARLDANRDGRITWGEAEGGRGGAGGRLMMLDIDKDGAVTPAEMGAIADRRFQIADANKDGWLSPAELQTMRQRARGGQGSE